MNISTNKPLVDRIEFSRNDLIVHLQDARVLSVPLAWFPKLTNASHQQLNHYEFLGNGEGIHWTDLDEDLSIAGLLFGIKLQAA
jgi:hypothetical protein